MAALERDVFFARMNEQGLALTFDDVTLDTGKDSLEQCYVTMRDVDISSRFSRNICLKTPMVSAAMDTVTGAKMAIAMAQLGGLGVIHGAMSVEEQRDAVRKVKKEQSLMVDKPTTVQDTETLEEVDNRIREEDYDFRTFPVLNNEGLFVGMLTGHDFDLNRGEYQKEVRDVMTAGSSVVSAALGTDAEVALKVMKEYRVKTLPILHKGVVEGMYLLSDINRILSGSSTVDEFGRLRVAAAVSTDAEGLERIEAMQEFLDAIVLDTAHGDSKFIFEAIKQIKERYGRLDLVVGNVSAGRSARLLGQAGVDGVKGGQGGGSICNTRTQTGIGCPQVTATYECAKALEEFDIPLCSDGGITHPGDISIALAAGAHSVMMGRMLAGTDECPVDVVTIGGRQMMPYRGMGSIEAMRENAASRKRYEVSESNEDPLAEGVPAYVPYQGSVHKVVGQYVQALRKSMVYVGAKDLEAHRTSTRFWRNTNAGMREAQPHDVEVLTTT